MNLSVAQYISYDLGTDGLQLKNPVFARILNEATEHSGDEEFCAEQYFTQHPDVELSNIAAKMVMDIPLTKSLQISSEEESLRSEAEHLVLDFRKKYIEERLARLKAEISKAAGDINKMRSLMQEYAEAQKIRNELARRLGNDIVS
jgi:DNA primase